MNFLLDGELTERLLFRTVVTSDYEAWLPFHKEPLSRKYWQRLPKDTDTTCLMQFDAIFKRYEQGLAGMNTLCKKTGSFISLCNLLVHEVDNMQELKIGYSILPAYWGNGDATKATQKSRNITFESEWASQLISIVHVHNVPSKMMALKLGINVREAITFNENPIDIYQIKN